MENYFYPDKKDWEQLVQRPVKKSADLQKIVSEVFETVQEKGDAAIRDYTEKFDKVRIADLQVSQDEFEEAAQKVPQKLMNAIQTAAGNIRKFHEAQQLLPEKIETTPGVVCWRESRPIQNVGLYIPGGSAPLFSTVLMLGIPAKIAGCKNIILCTPPNKEGEINPAILYSAQLVGITRIYKVGGIQAIAAMTLGTECIPKVDKLFGPGNQYVMAAKQKALECGLAIDMPAGPSEVLVVATADSNPQFVAADLLSQAEHGPDSQVILVTTSEDLQKEVEQEIQKQLQALPRKHIAAVALQKSRCLVFQDLDTCLEFSNRYAPEHLILSFDQAEDYVERVETAGSVFLGKYSCESAGDYASGTNHTLPTNGFARSYSGVSLDSFVKKITFQKLSHEGIAILGPHIEEMAAAEQLDAHKNAVTLRLQSL